MDDSMIVANWKSNMTVAQAKVWLEQMKPLLSESNKNSIICPPYTVLSVFSQELPIKQLGGQNISPFGMGAYTGEINGEQLKELVAYVIIGHSERRLYFKEDDEIIHEKVLQAKSNGIIPILCVQDGDTPIPQGVEIVAYEPVWAIGTGKAESPEHADEVAKEILSKTHVKTVLYGGSVTEENVHAFTSMQHIGGVLVGGASLDPQKFSQIILHA